MVVVGNVFRLSAKRTYQARRDGGERGAAVGGVSPRARHFRGANTDNIYTYISKREAKEGPVGYDRMGHKFSLRAPGTRTTVSRPGGRNQSDTGVFDIFGS